MNWANLPDRLPPQSLDAEQATLGCMMISRKAIPVVLGRVGAEDYYLDAHRRIQEAMRSLWTAKKPIDVLTVPEELARRGFLDHVGGVAYINTLAESVPTAANAEFYCDLVSETATLRRLLEFRESLGERIYSRIEDSETIRRAAIRELLSIAKPETHKPSRVSELVGVEVNRVCEGVSIPVMTFGIPAMDDFAGGLECGQVGFISGDPGSGKTALAHQIAKHASQTWGPVLIFSLEIAKEMVARRMLAGASGFTYREIRDARIWCNHRPIDFSDDDREELGRMGGQLAADTENLWVDSSIYTLDGMVARAHEWAALEGIRAIILDYVQLVEFHQAESRTAEVRAVARAVKNRLAADLNVTVLGISSLTKEGMKRPGGAGQGDMDGAAALAYDSSMSMLLTRDPNAAPDDDIRAIFARFAKNRNGRMGDLALTFHAPRYLITGRDQTSNEPTPIPAPSDDDAPLPRGTRELPLDMAADYAPNHYSERY